MRALQLPVIAAIALVVLGACGDDAAAGSSGPEPIDRPNAARAGTGAHGDRARDAGSDSAGADRDDPGSAGRNGGRRDAGGNAGNDRAAGGTVAGGGAREDGGVAPQPDAGSDGSGTLRPGYVIMPGKPPPERAGSEVCDGYDNDDDGIVDDLDAQGDGVCDCLNIATIGELGPWGNGGDVFSNWLRSRSPQGFVALGDQVLTDDVLRPFQIIVVLYAAPDLLEDGTKGHHEFGQAEVAAFERWVRAGGGVMTTIGYTWMPTEQENVNRLLAPLGMKYSADKLNYIGPVHDWILHPLTTRVSSIYLEHGVEPAGPADTTLARTETGQVALQAAEAGMGRVVVWGDEWITYDALWTNKADQQVARFWVNILQWLSPPKVCQIPLRG